MHKRIRTPFDEEIKLLKHKIETSAPPGSLEKFIAKTCPGALPAPHLRMVIDAIERTESKEVRLCLSLPPRHGKTTTVLHAIPYLLRRDPTKLHAYVTYGDALTKPHSRKMRAISVGCGVKLAKGAKSLSEWRTMEDGGLLATSIGGSLTGRGVNGCMLIDDALKGRAEADSPKTKEQLWEWFKSDAYSRIQPGGSCIVIGTRWAEDDLIGRIEAEQGHRWDFINLPAISDSGKALWPEAWPLGLLEDKRKIGGDYAFESLYQGRPRPRGAHVFKEPARYISPSTDREKAAFFEGRYLAIGVDPAASKGTRADYSVAVVLMKESASPESRSWVVDVLRDQMTIPDFVAKLSSMRRSYGCPIVVEAVGGFKAVPQMLEQVDPSLRIGKNLLSLSPSVDKFQRAQGVAAAWNRGSVLVPQEAPWVDLFLDEVLGFTGAGDRRDDQVDALAHAWNSLTSRTVRRRGYRDASGPFG